MAQTTLGIDIGSYSVKAVLVESSLKRQQVKAFREYHLTKRSDPMPDLDELREVARTIAADPGLKASAIAVGLPGFTTIKKWLQFPFDDRKKIDGAIGFPFGELVPIPFHELVIDYQITEKREDGAWDLLTIAAQKDLVGGVLDAFRGAGVDPRWLVPGGMSYLNLHSLLFPEGPLGCQAYVDIGYQSTEVLIVEGGLPKVYRTVLAGSSRLAAAVGALLGKSEAEAQEIVERTAELIHVGREAPDEAGRVQTVIREQVGDLLKEVRLVLHGHQVKGGCAPDRVFLTGGLSYLDGLRDHAEIALGLPVSPLELDLEWSAEIPPGPQRRAASRALALAWTPLARGDGAEINFRKGEYEYQGAFEYLKGKLGVLAVFVSLFVMVAGVKTWLDYQLVTTEYETMVGDLETLTKQYLGKGVDDFDTALRMIRKSSGFDLSTHVPKEGMYELLVQITDVMDRMNNRLPSELGFSETPALSGGGDKTKGDSEGKRGLPSGDIRDDKEGGRDSGSPFDDLDGEEEEEEERVFVELYELQIDRKALRMRAETNSVDAMEFFLEKAKSVPCLHHVLLENSDRISFRRHTGWRRFTLSATYECKAKDKAKDKARLKEDAKDKGAVKDKAKDPSKGGVDAKGSEKMPAGGEAPGPGNVPKQGAGDEASPKSSPKGGAPGRAPARAGGEK